jgi:hypothetical protein
MTCTRTDPCSPSPCSPGVTCTADLPAGRYHCGPCPPGLRGDGRDCTAPDPCRPNPCFPGVACRAVTSSDDGDSNAVEEDFECGVCPPGMHGDGKTCTGWFTHFELGIVITDKSRETREGSPLLTVETDENRDSKCRNERGLSLVDGSLDSSCRYNRIDFCLALAPLFSTVHNIIFLTAHFFTLKVPSASNLSRQVCWVACLCVSG